MVYLFFFCLIFLNCARFNRLCIGWPIKLNPSFDRHSRIALAWIITHNALQLFLAFFTVFEILSSSVVLKSSELLISIFLIFIVFFFFFLQVRHRFGLYDEISISNGFRVRHCNWIRFLRVSKTYGPQVGCFALVFFFLIYFYVVIFWIVQLRISFLWFRLYISI